MLSAMEASTSGVSFMGGVSSSSCRPRSALAACHSHVGMPSWAPIHATPSPLRSFFHGRRLSSLINSRARSRTLAAALKVEASGPFQDFISSFSTAKDEYREDVDWAKAAGEEFVGSARRRAGEAKRATLEAAESLLAEGKARAREVRESVVEPQWRRLRDFNRPEKWRDRSHWSAMRIGVALLYVATAIALGSKAYGGIRSLASAQQSAQIAQVLFDEVVPDPTPANVEAVKRELWRARLPEGFKLVKLKLGPDGEYHRDPSFPGETAWADVNTENPDVSIEKSNVDAEKSNVNVDEGRKWTREEKLLVWRDILERERLKEAMDAPTSKYSLEASAEKLRAAVLRAEEERRKLGGAGKEASKRVAWLQRRWWKHRPRLAYLDFVKLVKEGSVEAAVYSWDLRKGYVMMRDGFPKEFVVELPVDPYLGDLLMDMGVEVDLLPPSVAPVFRGLAILLPGIVMLLYLVETNLSLRVTAAERIDDLINMNRDVLITPGGARDRAQTQYRDVVIGGDVWSVLEEVMGYMHDPMKYHSKGVKLPRGILISGPPGTGKTLLARAIARECGLPFVFASGADFVSDKQPGEGSKKIFELFFTARANAPSFVFIDEVDALAGRKLLNDFDRNVTFEQFLAELDGGPETTDVDRFSLRQAVILICATNRPDELDDRFVRPGRIDREIFIGLPDEKERIGIFAVHSRGRKLAPDVDFTKLVYRTVGFSGADIRNFINEAGIIAARKRHSVIMQEDFVDVLDKGVFESLGISLTDEEQRRAERKVTESNRRMLAIHEAGHILLAHLFPRFDVHAFTHLMPGGTEESLTVFYPRQEMIQSGSTSVGYIRMQMVVSHGGRCSERVVNGFVSDGGIDDLKRINTMGRELASGYTSRRLGLSMLRSPTEIRPPKMLGPGDLVPNHWEDPETAIAPMSPEMAEMFSRELQRYVDDTEDMAMEALVANRHILDALVERLCQNSKITGEEAGAIVKSMNPVLLPDLLTPLDANLVLDDIPSDPSERAAILTGRYERLELYPPAFHTA